MHEACRYFLQLFSDPSYLAFFNVPSQLRDDHCAQGSGKILLPDDHAFEWPFLKNKKLHPMHSNECRRRKANFLLLFLLYVSNIYAIRFLYVFNIARAWCLGPDWLPPRWFPGQALSVSGTSPVGFRNVTNLNCLKS